MSRLISVDEALGLLVVPGTGHATRLTGLDEASGQILASDLHARVSRPPAAVSAMDGYAVRLTDVAGGEAAVKVIGTAPAGHPFKGLAGPGEAVRIFTGSVIPSGLDHIVIQEDVRREGDHIICTRAYDGPEFVRHAGIDFGFGDCLIRAGTRLGPAQLSVAAAANHAFLDVRCPPKVGLVTNGDELREPGSELADGEIVNSNPAGLIPLIRGWGADPVDLGVAADSTDAIRARIDAAGETDIFVAVGGASVGDHDLMQPAFQAAGFTIVFSGVAVRPGKPTWFARRGRQCVLGLPGNPASAFVCAHLFLRSLLMEQKTLPRAWAVTETDLPAAGARETFLRASARLDSQGRLMARPAANQDSSLIRPFLDANVLIRRRSGQPEVEAGTPVEILVIGTLG